MKPKIWSCVNQRVSRSNWSLKPKSERGLVADLSPVIKPVAFGSKVYRLGSYQGTLHELKEFAKMKNISRLTNGAISYKVA